MLLKAILLNAFIQTFQTIKYIKSENIEVTIPDGRLLGTVKTNYDGGKFYSFTGIPYAKPPVGEYRFKLPERNNPWKGVLNATQPPPACIQPTRKETSIIGQEDCLYLNVFTKSTKTYAKKPVLIYIHGGAFVQGRGTNQEPDFLMTKNIVLVTLNYRLGVLGFINTINCATASRKQMFGNIGYKDQVLALKWAQRNIQYFGGNPMKVTISGQSSGGMAVHAHVLSPLSAGLFQGAIAMSGNTLTPKNYAEDDTATPLAKYLGIDITNFNSMMQGLKNASNEDLFKAAKALTWYQFKVDKPGQACLVIEKPGPNSFISDYPLNIIKSGKYNKVSLFIGGTNREGLLIYWKESTNEHLKELRSHIPFFFNNKSEVMSIVQEYYNLNSKDPSNRIEFYTYDWYKYSSFRAAREHARKQDNVYYYEFAGSGKLNFLKRKVAAIQGFDGAAHADDLGYIFVMLDGRPSAGSIEEQLMRNEVNIWLNFMETGKPLEHLEMFQPNVHNFVNITNNGLEIGVINEDSFKLWDRLYERYSNGRY